MNLTGAQLYSRATSGLRRTGYQSKVFDQQFNLAFIYPMLFDARLQGKYSDTIRSFIAVSMLKEIFVSNALNIVAMASKDHPLIDERGQKLDMGAMITKSMVTNAGIDTGETQYKYEQPKKIIDPYQLQQKIQEKTAVIKKYLATEPRLKKINAYVEIITLDNMIDVPVIVGTKDYQISTLTLAFVLAASIALNKPLDKWVNVDYIFRVIGNMNQDDAWSLFNNMTEKTQSRLSVRIVDYIEDTLPSSISSKVKKYISYVTEPMERFKSGVKGATSFIGRNVGPYVPSRGGRGGSSDPTVLRHPGSKGIEYDHQKGVYRSIEDPTKEYDPNSFGQSASQFDILSVVKDELSQAKLFFKFMLDDELLRSQFGLSKSPGQMNVSGSKISEYASRLLDKAHQTFLAYMSRNIVSPMQSVFWLLTPWDSTVDFFAVKKTFFDAYVPDKLEDVIEQLSSMLYNSLIDAAPEDVMKRTKEINNLCDRVDSTLFREIQKHSQRMSENSLHSSRFDINGYSAFSSAYDDAVSSFSSVKAEILKIIKKAIPTFPQLFRDIESSFILAIDRMLSQYEPFYATEDNKFGKIAVFMNKKEDGGPIVEPEDTDQFIDDLRHGLLEILNVHFLAAIVPAICGYTDHLEIEVETVMNDALDLPNYTLVLPVETVAMLHAAVISKSWRDLVQRGNTQNTNLNDNYVKGIVKFIHNKINVPNLIVIDAKNNQVFYKLQYMSQVNKSNIRTFETYVQHLTKEELSSGQY